MLKVWGRDNSVNVQKVLWALAELTVAHERIDAGGQFGIVGEATYKAMNPNSRVPTLADGDFILWESNACVRYLAAKHGAGSLWPEDLQVRADADRWMDWQTTTIWPALRPGFWQIVRTPTAEQDPAAIETSRKETGAALAIADSYLADRPYLAGDSFSMGDIPLACAAQRWFNLPWERPELPNLAAWYERIKARNAFGAIVDRPLT